MGWLEEPDIKMEAERISHNFSMQEMSLDSTERVHEAVVLEMSEEQSVAETKDLEARIAHKSFWTLLEQKLQKLRQALNRKF